jgi:RNA polymerase sigma-70 factor (ECF subfamily)
MAIYTDDRELLAAHRAGDTEAFDELVREYRQSLHRHAYKRLLCNESAEDAVQETLVRAYRALPNFSGEYRLGPWLHRIMQNVCIDEGNRQKKDMDKTGRAAALPNNRMDSPSIEEELHLDFDDSDLQAAMSELPDPYREALVMRFVNEMGYDEVASRTGATEQNVRARVSRGRSLARSAMRGLAILPVLLLGLLKKSEKAVAASTSIGGGIGASAVNSSVTVSSSTVMSVVAPSASAVIPTVSEAIGTVSHAAPLIMPVIAKAAVGIGLVAAVLTPNTDSALHQAVEDIRSPLTAESQYGFEAAELNDSVAIVVPSLGEQATNSESTSINDQISLKNKSEYSESASSEGLRLSPRSTGPSTEVLLFGSESSSKVSATDSNRLVEGSDERVGGLLSSSNFEAVATGPDRFDLSGSLAIEVSGSSLSGSVASESQVFFWSDSSESARRFDLSLNVMLDNGSVAEFQFAGFAVEAEASMELSGVFRLNSSIQGLIPQGSFVGVLPVAKSAGKGLFSITLLP